VTSSLTRRLSLVTLVAVATGVAAVGPAPKRLPLVQVWLDFTGRDAVRVTLRAAPEVTAAKIVDQRLTVGDVAVHVPGSPLLDARDGESFVTLTLPLRGVPASVLDLPLQAVPVRWFGLDRQGRALVVVSGTIDPLDRTQLVLHDEQIRRYFATLGPVSVTPGLDRVGLRCLLSVYNPFGFDLVVTGMNYRLAVGERELLEERHPGFRLRAGQSSDVLIEESVPTGDAILAGVSLLRNRPVGLAGSLTLRTPQGEREFPLFILGAP
jgi:hypothetical protein